MKKILLLAASLYLLLAPITYHPDNKLVLKWAGSEKGAVWNIWEYGEANLPEGQQFNYPPFHFYLAKLQYFIAKPIAGEGFDEWLSTSNDRDGHEQKLVRYNLAIKFTLILFTVLIGYLLYRLAIQHTLPEGSARAIALLWLFNPIVIYSTPVMGQNDVMAIAFFLLGWLALHRLKTLAAVLFGLAASIKMYPLIWLIFLLLSMKQLDLKKKISIFVASLGVYILTILPFLSNATFRKAVLGSGINDRFLIAQIDLGFSEAVHIVPILLTLLMAIIIYKKSTHTGFGLQALAMLSANLILLGFTHFHPQWYTWAVPFWAIWLVTLSNGRSYAVMASFLTFCAWLAVILLFKDSYLSFGILTPLNQSLILLPSVQYILENMGVVVEKYNNLAHTWLAGIAVVSLWQVSQQTDFKNNLKIIGPKIINRFPKYVRYSIQLLGIFLITLFTTVVMQAIPAPVASNQPVIRKYVPLTDPMQTSFQAEYSGLSRIHLYFKNPDLKNTDTYQVVISGAQGELHQQNFSGFNTGFEGSVRFDFGPRADSDNQIYEVQISPITTSDSNLEIGIVDSNNEQSLAVMSYYDVNLSISELFEKSLSRMSEIFLQLPLLYILVFILLFFAL